MNFVTAWVLLNAIWWGILCVAIVYTHKEDGVKLIKECGIKCHVVCVLLSIPITIYVLVSKKAS